MRKFLYRSPRYMTEFPMELEFNGCVVSGICFDISQSGARGSFGEPIPVGTAGRLTLHYGKSSFTVDARVAQRLRERTGLRFVFASEYERGVIERFLKVISPAASPAFASR